MTYARRRRVLSLGASALLLVVGSARAQDFERVMTAARDGGWDGLPFGAVMQRVGEQFLGAPYEAGLLDRSPDEPLVTVLDRFDCVLFVESVLALSRGIAVADFGLPAFEERIEEQRYRDGRRSGYCSRLHYFSEWIVENERRGTVRNVTRELGGEVLDKRLDFMGIHRESYPLLADDSLYAGILEMERRLEGLEIVYIPEKRIRAAYPRLQAGDIVALATSVDGLDVSHTGLVYDPGDGSRGMLHASLAGGVVVSPDIQSYVENNPSQLGIVVVRPVDPRTR